jgi:hypothetical protein
MIPQKYVIIVYFDEYHNYTQLCDIYSFIIIEHLAFSNHHAERHYLMMRTSTLSTA